MCVCCDSFHSGIEVVERTSFTYTGRDHQLELIGLKMHIPDNALPIEVAECQVHLESSVCGQFQFPPETELISGVYWITSTHSFTKDVTVEIQHCANLDLLQHLTFVVAKHAQENLPYEFTAHEKGVFPSGSQYGKIALPHFCGLAITTRKIELTRCCCLAITTEESSDLESKRYCGQLFYRNPGIKSCYVDFVIMQDLGIYWKVSISAVNRA